MKRPTLALVNCLSKRHSMSKFAKKQAKFAFPRMAQSIIPLDLGQMCRSKGMALPTTITSLVEYEHISEMQQDLRRKLHESSRKELGRMDNLRSSILNLVVNENYARSVEEMVAYVDLRTAFPGFQERAQRLIQHCSELIQAINTKRNFPGLAGLSLAKQQEVHDKVLEHFEDLKHHLRQIERVEREHKLEDARSTIWVMRALCHSIVLIFIVAFILDMKNGAFGVAMSVTDGIVDNLSRWVVNLINL